MIVLDPAVIPAIAALLTGFSTLVWSLGPQAAGGNVSTWSGDEDLASEGSAPKKVEQFLNVIIAISNEVPQIA